MVFVKVKCIKHLKKTCKSTNNLTCTKLRIKIDFLSTKKYSQRKRKRTFLVG